MSHSSLSRPRRAGALAVVMASLAFAVPAGAQEQPIGSVFYSVAADSSPVGVEFFDGGAPVIPGEIVYVSPVTTRAAIDSNDASAGFAGGPYLGDNVPALMGAANALGPAGPVLPAYPFMVNSQYPGAEKSSQTEGPRHLAANSGPNSSEGEAYIALARGNPGLVGVSSKSVAKHDPGTGVLTAAADGAVEAFSVGSTLTISQLATHAEVTGKAGDKPAKKSSLSIGGITINGTLVGLTDKGLAPVPGTPPTADINALAKQLDAAGIVLGILPGAGTDTSVDSAALVVGFAKEIPGHGLMKVRVILGRVRATLDSSRQA